jgi:hypothetical protein
VSAGSAGHVSISRAKSGSTGVSGALGTPLFAQAVSEIAILDSASGDFEGSFDSLRLHWRLAPSQRRFPDLNGAHDTFLNRIPLSFP